MIGKSLGHYKVLRRIGAGGMGVVYLAHDERLERDVAIKVMPSGTVADEAARKRFRREALALSRLNHPNVATIFDFNTTEDGTDYLVTEYIAGVGLDEQIARAALPIRQVLNLGSQLAHGLAAAHAQNIVHRDLKPANVRINTDGRLKVLDFGLAMLVQPEADLALTMSLTSSQQITGTLPYMAPEQLRGQLADARTDVWAAGVVLYEMATGRRPFSQRNGPMLINSILNEPPDPPTKINSSIPPGLEYIILKSLEKDPALRYQTSRELGADLDRLTTGESLVSVAHPRRSRFLLFTSVLCVLLAAVVAIYFMTRRSPKTGTALNVRRSVAVLGFKNLSGRPDSAWVSTALAEMLTTELAAGEKLFTISGENVARVKGDLALPETDTLAPDTLTRVRKSLGSDYVVMGSYLDMGGAGGDQIRVDLRLQDAVAGQTIAAVSEKGSLSELDDLVTRAGANLRSKLGVGEVATAEEIAAHARRPANLQAARLYALGLEKLRAADALAARDLFLKAVEADPKHADSWAALASVWSTLGYDAKSNEAAKHALQLAAEFPREERLRFEGQSYEADSQWDKAIASYRALFELEPDNIDNGLKLANTQIFAGRASEAMQTLARLRQLPAPRNEDLRIDLAEARAAHFLSDFKREREIAVAAAQKGEKQGARFLVARDRLAECLALRNMGDPKGSIPVCQEAQRIFDLAGDRYGVATALNGIGNALYDMGDLVAARKTYEQVMQIDREIGNMGGLAGAMDNLASVAGDQGDKATARKLAHQALALYRETGDKMNISATLNNIASEMVVNGDLIGSREMFDEALALGREIHSDSTVAITLVNLGEVRLDLGDTDGAASAFREALSTFQKNNEKGKSAYPLVGLGEVLTATGDLKGARESLEQGLALSNEIGEKHESAVALSNIGRVLMLAGDLGEARRRFEQALALRKELDEKDAVSDSLFDLAELSLEEGEPARAEQSLRVILSSAGNPDLLAGAHALLGQALLAQGKKVEARKQATLAMASASKTQRQRILLQTKIHAAAVQAASGASSDVQSATRVLREIIQQCERMRYKQFGLQATLALSEIELRGPEKNASRHTLESLEKEARAAGFNLMAARAARALLLAR